MSWSCLEERRHEKEICDIFKIFFTFMVSTLKGKQQLPAITDLFYCYEVAKKVHMVA